MWVATNRQTFAYIAKSTVSLIVQCLAFDAIYYKSLLNVASCINIVEFFASFINSGQGLVSPL